MLTLLAEGKEFKINEQVVIVKKITIKQYYLLLMSLFLYKKAYFNCAELNIKTTVKDYIDFIKNHTLDIAITKVEFNNIKLYLKDCVDVNIDKLEQIYVCELLNNVIEFNSINMGKGKTLDNIEQLNEDIEMKVGLIANILKTNPAEVLEMKNYDMCVLLREYNRKRISMINDIRLAYHGDKQNYIKYTKGLMGEIVYSAQEILNNPELLKQAVH